MLLSIRHIFQFVILILALSLLAGCGFHLVGNRPIPSYLSKVYIQSRTPFGNFEQALRNDLRQYNIDIVDSPDQANSIINVVSSELSQTAGAASADLQTRQYTLTYTVKFQLLSPKQFVVLPTMTAYSSATFTAQLSQMTASTTIPTEYQQPLLNDVLFRMLNLLFANDNQQKAKQFFSHANHPSAT